MKPFFSRILLILLILTLSLLCIPMINQRLYAFIFDLLRFLVLFFTHLR